MEEIDRNYGNYDPFMEEIDWHLNNDRNYDPFMEEIDWHFNGKI